MNKAIGGLPFQLSALLMAVLVAGCAGTGPAPDAPLAPAPSKPGPRTASIPQPAPEPKPTRRPEPEIHAPKAAEVIGWSTAQLSDAFGGASLVRRDLGAEIWQYRTSDCVLLVFLYPVAGPDTALRVEHLDARGDDAMTDTCLKSVVRKHAAVSRG